MFRVFLLSGSWLHFHLRALAEKFIEDEDEDAQIYDDHGACLGCWLHGRGWVA